MNLMNIIFSPITAKLTEHGETLELNRSNRDVLVLHYILHLARTPQVVPPTHAELPRLAIEVALGQCEDAS
jgi:hypothetical protein